MRAFSEFLNILHSGMETCHDDVTYRLPVDNMAGWIWIDLLFGPDVDRGPNFEKPWLTFMYTEMFVKPKNAKTELVFLERMFLLVRLERINF